MAGGPCTGLQSRLPAGLNIRVLPISQLDIALRSSAPLAARRCLIGLF